ncbi:MAG: hypothetical protein GY865_08720 [candidate division Zixibacteria bacterium]|nr:hypothetical protein [candidate division Zixibacteria bacterium]
MVTAVTSLGEECGDIDGIPGINILDIVHLIDFKYKSGPDPICDIGASEIGTVTDIDGNVYITAKIGDQTWMLQNLKVTNYRNGDPIPNVTDDGAWGGLSTGAYCEYDNDINNVSTYGRLYNWHAVDDSRNIAPEGWHVPTDAEWQTLVDYLGGVSVAGGKMKETGTTHWDSPNTGATNESGFSGLPGGYRYGTTGPFYYVGRTTLFWSSTEYFGLYAWYRTLDYSYSDIGRSNLFKNYGFSVRCVKD